MICPHCKKKLPREHRWHGIHEKCFEPYFGVPVLVGGSARTVRKLAALASAVPTDEQLEWVKLYCEPRGLWAAGELTNRGRQLVDQLTPRLALLDQALAKRDAEGTPGTPFASGAERQW